MINWSVYLVTDRHASGVRSVVDVVRAAIQGGATVVQLRDKTASTRAMLELGQALHTVTRAASVPLIVNDRIDVAMALEAEGVHVGQDDMPAAVARRLIGPGRLLGVSVETVDQARQAEQDGADYLGVGDVFGTPSKPDANPAIGLERLAHITRAVAIPSVAIGGVTLDNAASAIHAGAVGVAVISAIFAAPDPCAAARALREQVERLEG